MRDHCFEYYRCTRFQLKAQPPDKNPGVLCHETKDNPICGNIGQSINTFYKLVIKKSNLEKLMLKIIPHLKVYWILTFVPISGHGP